jgi:hypothetical protein
MQRIRIKDWSITLSILTTLLATASSQAFFAQRMWDFPSFSSAVDQAVSADHLRSVARTNNDPDVLLGLAFLARAGDPVRQEISTKAMAARAEYAPNAVLLALVMDGINSELVAELIRRDPDNALGHYLNGKLLHDAHRTNDALIAFKTGAACPEFRLYRSTLSDALLKALDALGIVGRDRLAALCWMEVRWSSFSMGRLQFLDRAVSESVLSDPVDNRAEVSDLLVVMAGHFSAADVGPEFSHRALLHAYRLKAELASEQHSPAMHAYASVAQALASVVMGGDILILNRAGVDISKLDRARIAARYLPGRIWSAISITSDVDAYRNSRRFNQVPGKHVDRAIKAANHLVDLAQTDPEGTIIPYLRGHVPEPRDPRTPWKSALTPIEQFVVKQTKVFRAAVAFEEAQSALSHATIRDNWPGYRRRLALQWTLVAMAACCGGLLLHRLGKRCRSKLASRRAGAA